MRDFKGSADDFAVGGTGGVTGVSWPVFRCIQYIFDLYGFFVAVVIHTRLMYECHCHLQMGRRKR